MQQIITAIDPVAFAYDFGARMYDARIGRWMKPDDYEKLSPAWTPYRFGLDNPIRYVDWDGNIERDPFTGQINFYPFDGGIFGQFTGEFMDTDISVYGYQGFVKSNRGLFLPVFKATGIEYPESPGKIYKIGEGQSFGYYPRIGMANCFGHTFLDGKYYIVTTSVAEIRKFLFSDDYTNYQNVDKNTFNLQINDLIMLHSYGNANHMMRVVSKENGTITVVSNSATGEEHKFMGKTINGIVKQYDCATDLSECNQPDNRSSVDHVDVFRKNLIEKKDKSVDHDGNGHLSPPPQPTSPGQSVPSQY